MINIIHHDMEYDAEIVDFASIHINFVYIILKFFAVLLLHL